MDLTSLLNVRIFTFEIASFTLQVLIINSDLLQPISNFLGCPFAHSFNCDLYPIHVFTLAIAPETSHMRCCNLSPLGVLPPEKNVTFADKMSHSEQLRKKNCCFQRTSQLFLICWNRTKITHLKSIVQSSVFSYY